MLLNRAVQLAMVAAAAMLCESQADAASAAFRLCGRKLGEIMSRVCHVYNSPSWDVPTVVEQPAAVVRRKRQSGGIADECCTYGCTWEQLTEYCSVTNSEILDALDTHMIADRSAEQETLSSSLSVPPAVAGQTHKQRDEASKKPPREVGSARSRGYGRARGRCWCRRKRRSGRRRASLMGNMDLVRSASRAAPVVGTVSPLLTWGRTLNTDLPQVERDRYAYVAVYTT